MTGVSLMETHEKERQDSSDWKADQVNIVNFLRNHCGLAERYSEELIHKVCGILAVNAFEAHSHSEEGDNDLRAIYPQQSQDKNLLLKRMSEAADILAEAVDILSLEEENSTEGQLAIHGQAGEEILSMDAAVACERLAVHRDLECAVFAAAKVTFPADLDPDADCPQLECITPLRLLLNTHTDRWRDEVSLMETHEKERRDSSDWKADQVNIVNFLRRYCRLADSYSEELIHKVCGILVVNAFEAYSQKGDNSLRVIYPQHPQCKQLITPVHLAHLLIITLLRHQVSDDAVAATSQSSAQFEFQKLNGVPDSCPLLLHRSTELGRYLVAERDISEGEVLLRELPLQIGPQAESAPICLGCHKPLGFSPPHTCSKCGVGQLCGPACESSSYHWNECNAFKMARPASTPLLVGDEGHWQVVLPLRCFVNQIKGVFQLESHLESRRDTEVWANSESNVVNVLHKHGLLCNFPGKVIQRACGILDVNCFEVRGPADETGRSECLRAVYQNAAYMAHSCVPNTHVAIGNDYTLIVKAAMNIAKGEKILNNYSDALMCTAMRRECLKMGKYFSCECRRCVDPTELGSHLSSLRCSEQTCEGSVVSEDPLRPAEANWRCTACGRTLDAMSVLEGLRGIQRDLAFMDRTNARAMEELMARFNRSLHPQNAAVLEVTQALSGLYREKLMDFGPSKAPPALLKRKLELCRSLLQPVEILEPPLSRLRGITLYEVASPLAALTLQQAQNRSIAAQEAVAQLERAEEQLREAARLLLHEPPGAPEAQLARVALLELRDVRQEITNLGKVAKKSASKNKGARKKKK
ncbi:hypothetical protein B566_EDAN004899 [Ephemera danica]|nr:hypothetical protein B566_EDAN004899 [Ephemera danica]